MQLLFKCFSILIFTIITGCKAQDNTLSFNENDYKLVSTKKDNLGNKYSETFINIKDTGFHLKKIYWENGKIQGIIFLTNKKKMGPAQFYDTSGIILNEDFFYNEIGFGIQYDYENKKTKLIIYKNDNIIHKAAIEDYLLIEVSKHDLENKYAEIFTSNSNYFLKKIIWNNENIQAVAFFSIHKQATPGSFYSKGEHLQYEGFYYEDREQGITIQYGVQSKKAIIKTNKQK